MTITIHSTTDIVEVNGVPARVWEGYTESGIAVQCLVTRVAVHKNADHSQFEAELREQREPKFSEHAFPLRMVL